MFSAALEILYAKHFPCAYIGARVMDPRVVDLNLVSSLHGQIVGYIHVDYSFLFAFAKKRQECTRHLVHGGDVGVEDLVQVVPASDKTAFAERPATYTPSSPFDDQSATPALLIR